MSSAIRALGRRQLIADVTHKNLGARLDSIIGNKSVYCGFDPTAESLHLGNLIQLLALRRFQQCGLTPIVLIGGATGRIGDPSGKSVERAVLEEDTIQHNVTQLANLIDPLFPEGQVEVLNNFQWHNQMTAIDLLRRAGRYFRINSMIAKETVKRRLGSEDQGMSFLEFSYPLFQAYDFLHLHRTKQCVLQIGGSDQWGNITAGCDLVRKTLSKDVFGLTIPLLTTQSGAKFGKSEGNAIWLDESMTSCYDFYQYFMRAEDVDVQQLLYTFTFKSVDEIDELVEKHRMSPEKRIAQRELADSVTRLVHGEEGLAKAKQASSVLFGGSIDGLSATQLLEIVANVPSIKLPVSTVVDTPILDFVVKSGACTSKAQVRRLIQAGGLYINNQRCLNEKGVMQASDLVDDKLILLRTGNFIGPS